MVASVAPVKPRVVSPLTGETILLDEVLRDWIGRREPRILQVIGAYGTGKSTALQHAAATLPEASDIRFLDDPDLVEVSAGALQSLVVCGSTVRLDKQLAIGGVVWLELAPWGNDEFIEYLLAAHHDKCASVLGRISAAPDRQLLHGNPELSRLVLDRMAADERLSNVKNALLQEVHSHLSNPELAARLGDVAFELWTDWPPRSQAIVDVFADSCPPQLSRLLRHRAVQESLVVIAAKEIVARLAANEHQALLEKRLCDGLIREIAAQLDDRSRAVLIDITNRKKYKPRQSMAASILVADNRNWRPAGKRCRQLGNAYLVRAGWRGIDLSGHSLESADFSRSDLRDAKIDGARASMAKFRAALMDSASMCGFVGDFADFTQCKLTHARADKAKFDFATAEGADLSDGVFHSAVFLGANLAGAKFCRADLTRASLQLANIANADFTGANLTSANLSNLKLHVAEFTGARFVRASLLGCDLESMHLPHADFESANLPNALLTGSMIRDGVFRGADLQGAALAEIEWEGADLRNANLRGCTFHMGSSRSGLVHSPIASEGTRTGFYTDDVNEQHFKAPEEIRKANLCHADLRGAIIDGTDFYLVDLRGAKYDRAQRMYFERCGAILEDRR